MRARVFVTLKTGVHDPQGQTVAEALRRMDYDVGTVRCGKLIELDLPAATNAEAACRVLRRMCEALLANPVIEDYRIEIAEQEP